MPVKGFACLVWNAYVDEWSSLCCSDDRAKVQGFAERLREITFIPTRVVACDLLDDDMIYVGGVLSFVRPVPAEYGPPFSGPDHDAANQ